MLRHGCSQKAPSAKRCIKTCPAGSSGYPRPQVRKHRAPKGALRPPEQFVQLGNLVRQKAPSAPNFARNSLLLTLYQLSEIAEFQRSDFKRRNNRPGITCNIFAEPSAARTKRCIMTAKSSSLDHRRSRVRKHRAPNGALRHTKREERQSHQNRVRKHRAPQDALRPVFLRGL